MKKFLRNKRVGFKVTPCKAEPVIKKKSFKLNDAQKLAKSVALEVCGFQPYEKKAIEYIKSDNVKKARKYLKIKLGSLARGEKKMDILMKHAR